MTKKKKPKNSKKNSVLKFLDSFSASFKYISTFNFVKYRFIDYWLQWSNGMIQDCGKLLEKVLSKRKLRIEEPSKKGLSKILQLSCEAGPIPACGPTRKNPRVICAPRDKAKLCNASWSQRTTKLVAQFLSFSESELVHH